MAIVYGHLDPATISVGTTQAVINCNGDDQYPVGSGWSVEFELTPGSFQWDFIVATQTSFATYTTYSSKTQYYDGDESWNVYAFRTNTTPYSIQDFTVTNLTAENTYYYKLRIYNEGSWSTSASYGTLTTPATGYPPTVDFTAFPLSGYPGVTVRLTATNTSSLELSDWVLAWGDGATDFAGWWYGDTPEQSLENRTHQHVYYGAGSYTVVLTATNADGVDTETKTAFITTSTPTITATYEIVTSWATRSDGHRDVYVTLTDSSTSPTPNSLRAGSRLWTVSKGTSASYTGSQDPFELLVRGNVDQANPGYWTVQLQRWASVGATYGVVTNTQAFIVPYAAVDASFKASPLGGYTPQTITFYDLSTGDGLTKSWNFGDGQTSTSTATTVTNVYETQGVYNATLTVTGSDVASTTVSDSVARLNYITILSSGTYHNLLGGLFREVQWTLMCDPDATPCTAFSEFGGVDNLTTIYYRKLREFLRDTEVTQTETTSLAEVGSSGVYTLPSALIKLLRVEVDGVRVEPLDRKQADLAYSGWSTTTTTTGDCAGYLLEPEDALTLRLVPLLSGKSANIKAIYVEAPDTPSVPADCLDWGTTPLPHGLSWVVKWGMIADLLRQEGEMNDPVRAAFAEEIYQMGIQLAKLLLYRGGGQ